MPVEGKYTLISAMEQPSSAPDTSIIPAETTPLIPSIPNPTNTDTHDKHHISNNNQTAHVVKSSPKATLDDEGHTTANQALSPTRGTLVVLALGILIFTVATNMSLLTTTQSAIAEDLEAFEVTTWFTSAFLIPTSALAPLHGKLSSVFSPRACMCLSAVVLAVGGGVCAAARTFEVFVAGRGVQGVGASGIFIISIIVVLELTGSKRRGLGIGLLNTGLTVGVAGGATAAGALLPVMGWRALFWLQLPICVVGGLVLLFTLPGDFHAGEDHIVSPDTWKQLRNLDYLGAILLTTSLVLVLYAMAAPKQVPGWPIVVSIFVMVLFVNNEVYLAHDPIIPITLLKSRGLLLTCLGTMGFMMGRWSVLFYAPTYALAVRTWSPSTAGTMLIPTNLGFALGGLSVGWLHIKRQGSFYAPTLVTYLLFPITLALLGFMSTATVPAWAFVLVLSLCGFVTGAATNYTLAHLLHITPKESHYVATALLATFRGFAGSFASAIGGGLFTRSLHASLTSNLAHAGLKNPHLVRQLLGSPALVGRLEGVEREIAVHGYQDALKLLWLVMAAIGLATFFVQAGTGWKGYAVRAEFEDERRALLHDSGVIPEQHGANIDTADRR